MSEKKYYASPRWSGELLDCSMPMTFDTYSECSYRCLYCFAFFQKSIGGSAKYYFHTNSVPVNVEAVKKIFIEKQGQFGPYVTERKVMQWGGMSDPFDENERKQGVSIELLKFFRSIEYPLSICTKAAWWTKDDRYIEQFKGAAHINLKVSIVTTDAAAARKVEVLAPSPEERLEVIKTAASWGIGGVTLRLRPFIIGLTDKTYIELIQRAAEAGASAVSTEFMCLEGRSKKARGRFDGMSRLLGFDVFQFYKMNSRVAGGYMRLNREIKKPYIEKMQEECHRFGMRFYVSDAHFKERCDNGSCCGLSENWNYSRGQFTEALLIAKQNGIVKFSDIAKNGEFLNNFPFGNAEGFNQSSSEKRAKYYGFSMLDYMRWNWNNVNGANSPYKYFDGILVPIGKDENGDVIYEYRDSANNL